MKLTARTIPDYLRAPAKQTSAVLLYGPDGGLARERCKHITTTLGATPVELGAEKLKEDPAALGSALSAMSLFGDAQVVVLRDATDKHAKAIEETLALPGEKHFLIVTADELTPRSPLRQLFEMEAKLAALPCYKDESADIASLIRQRFEQEGIRAGRDVVDYLAAEMGNDRGVTRAELDKIALYVGAAGTLSLAEAELLSGGQREVSADDVALATASQDTWLLETRLRQALREGATPVAVLRAVQRHFQRLLVAREHMARGMHAEAAVAALKPPVFFRQVPIVTRQASQWHPALLLKALASLASAELACKNSSADPALLVSRALVSIAKMRLKTATAT